MIKTNSLDPNIQEFETLSINGLYENVPVFTSGEIYKIIDSVKTHSEEYYQDSRAPEKALYSISKSMKYLSNENKREEVLDYLSRVTPFSKENIQYFCLNPIKNFNIEEGTVVNPKNILELIDSENYNKFTEFGGGYLKGYGEPEVKFYRPPELITQILSPNIIGLPWYTIILGPLSSIYKNQREKDEGKIRGVGQIIKLPSEDKLSFLLFLRLIEDIDPDFRKTIASGYWRGGSDIEYNIFSSSDFVHAMGSDKTIESIRNRIDKINLMKPTYEVKTRFLGHPNKESFSVVSNPTPEAAELVAYSNTAVDGYGCFNPINCFFEKNGDMEPLQFAEAVSEEMDKLLLAVPKFKSHESINSVNEFRNKQLGRMLVGEDVKIFKPRDNSTSYTVILDNDNPYYTPTCRGRTIILKPISIESQTIDSVKDIGPSLQVAELYFDTMNEIFDYSNKLGNVGVSNVHPLGGSFIFKLFESHDGFFNVLYPYMTDNLYWCSINFKNHKKETEKILDEKRSIVY